MYSVADSGVESVVSMANCLSCSTNAGSFKTLAVAAAKISMTALGVPAGVTPAVGVAFVAKASVTIGGGATVQAPKTNGSGIDHVEIIGDPNVMLANSAQPSNGGGYLIAACFLSNVLTQPADGSVIGLSFYFNDSSVVIQGE
jgi:hypothetical protein